jgi:hypothetical protein
MRLAMTTWLTCYPSLSLTGVVPDVCDAEAGQTGEVALDRRSGSRVAHLTTFVQADRPRSQPSSSQNTFDQ